MVKKRVELPDGAVDEWFGIHEVYYLENDGSAVTQEPIPVVGETVEELRETLERMLTAFDQPLLDYDDLGGEKRRGDASA
ncbi:MAG: hypothetical protein WD960_04675 [Gemmatimonadota bacterium]